MKFSELDIKKLSPDDIYDLVMAGVKDYSKQHADETNMPDFIVLLGCTPLTLEQRVLKLIELYDKGYGKYIILTGGLGWHKLFKADPDKKFIDDKELFNYTRKLNENLKKQKKSLSKIFEKDLSPASCKLSDTDFTYKKYYKRRRKLMHEYLEESEAELGYRMIDKQKREDIQQVTLIETGSVNTIQNVLFTRNIIDDLVVNCGIDKPKRLMLITSPFHCRRACLTFKKYFPDCDVIACPSTAGMVNKGVPFTKEALMGHEYYSKQFRNECDAIINYSRKGDIADIDISGVVGPRRASEIEERVTGETINRE